MYTNTQNQGFTLIEVIVVTSIIAILAGVAGLNFSEARAKARDANRAASLEQLQVAIELYRAQYGYYPAEGCGSSPINPGDTPNTTGVDWDGDSSGGFNWTAPNEDDTPFVRGLCPEYIVGLVPNFISELPRDPMSRLNRDFRYMVSSDGQSYKVVNNAVEVNEVDGYGDPYARCPFDVGDIYCDATGPRSTDYAVYSAGAESW